MATELDLDINNYNISDIEQFFKFNSKSKYVESDIEKREYEIREQLLSSGHINKKLKSDLIQFLKLAKQWLIDIKCKKNNPTSIPKNFRLDTDNYPGSEIPPQREENLIEPPKPQFIYTQPSEYYPGVLNPLDKRITKKILCIDTLFRPNYDKTKSSDFIYTLPYSLNNVVSMQLIASEIPRMWYSFSSTNNNNSFTLELFNLCKTNQQGFRLDNSGNMILYASPPNPSTFMNYKYTFTIPNGNYTAPEMTFALTNLFSGTLTDDYGEISGALKCFIIEIDPKTTCTIIRVLNEISEPSMAGSAYTFFPYYAESEFYSPDFYFTLTFNSDPTIPLYKSLGWMLGFRKAKYTINSLNTRLDNINLPSACFFEGYIQSESSYGSMLDNYIFLEIDDFHNNFPTDTIISMNNDTSSYLGKNIMNRISLTSNPNTVLDNNSADRISKKREYFGPVKIEKLRIRLLNRFGDVLDMNKNDYSIVLEINQLYAS